ncbi:phosphohydrolase [Nocardia brasiliensis]
MIDRRNWNTLSLGLALIDQPDPPLRFLPVDIAALLVEAGAPPRLGATLRLVYDVACQLIDWLQLYYRSAPIDAAAVMFGAATYDIGKVAHPEELSAPGSAHEDAGYRLLLAHGIGADLARFCLTHARWEESYCELDDLLVSLAAKICTAERVPELEQLVVRHLAAACDTEPWVVFLDLNDELTRIALDAGHRRAFQARYPING